MVSRNNIQEKIRKFEEKRERHSIRKFAAGAASVLIGLSFMGMNNQTASADVIGETEVANEQVEVQKETNTVSEQTQVVETAPVTTEEDVEKVSTVQNIDESQENNAEQEVTEEVINQVSPQASTRSTKAAKKTTKTKKTQTTNKDKINNANSAANKDLTDAVNNANKVDGVTVTVGNKKPINVSSKDDLDKKLEELKELNNAEINKILAALKDHEAKMEKYKNDLATFEKAKADYIETLKKLGLWSEDGNHIDPSTLSQLLILGKEEATIKAESLVGDKVVKGDKKVLQLDNFWEVKESIKGDFLKVTYTNLKNSTYAGKKISKIVVTFSDFDISNHPYQGNNASGIYFSNNPIDGFFYRKCSGVTMNLEMYDASGKLIRLGENTAYITIGSLNNGTSSTKYPEYVEKAEILSGGHGIVLPESSINVHKGPNGDILYADKDNELIHKNPTATQIEEAKKIWGDEIVKYLNWDDDVDRSKDIFGSGLFQVSGDNIKIRFSNELGSAWVTYSTTIPKLTFDAVKPELPETKIEVVQPELKLNSNVYIHYVDVHDEAMKGTTEFLPHHGTELTDKMHAHTDREVGSIYNTELWDWTSANYILAAQHGDEVLSGIVTDDDQHHYIYLKRDVETISRDKVVKQVIHYIYEDGTKAFDDHVSVDLKFTQTGYRDKVTGEEVWDGEWTPTQTFVTVVSPKLEGYTVDRPEVGPYEITVTNENFDQNLDKEDTVIYTKVSQPTNPEQPTSPSEPTNPTTPEQPTDPVEPAPVLPENPVESDQPDDEVIDEEEKSEIVAPKPQKVSAKKASKSEKTVSKSVTPQKVENRISAKEELPQTDAADNKASWFAGIAAILGLIGLAGSRKRKNNK